MKVTVDLEDFYLEEDESLSDALKSHVTHHVIQDIWGKIKLRVEQALSLIHISEPTRPCGTSRMPSSA